MYLCISMLRSIAVCMYVCQQDLKAYVCMYVCMYGSVLLYDVISKGKWKRVRAQKDVAFYLPDLRMGAFERSELRYILYVCVYCSYGSGSSKTLVFDFLCVCRKHLLHE